MPAGRPFGTFNFRSVEELQTAIDDYFDKLDKSGLPPSMTSLALALNVSPATLCNYAKNDYAEGKYFDAVNRARMRIVAYYEMRAFDKEGVQGAKFMLTNNAARMGGLEYHDKVEQSISMAPISFVDDLSDDRDA